MCLCACVCGCVAVCLSVRFLRVCLSCVCVDHTQPVILSVVVGYRMASTLSALRRSAVDWISSGFSSTTALAWTHASLEDTTLFRRPPARCAQKHLWVCLCEVVPSTLNVRSSIIPFCSFYPIFVPYLSPCSFFFFFFPELKVVHAISSLATGCIRLLYLQHCLFHYLCH